MTCLLIKRETAITENLSASVFLSSKSNINTDISIPENSRDDWRIIVLPEKSVIFFAVIIFYKIL